MPPVVCDETSRESMAVSRHIAAKSTKSLHFEVVGSSDISSYDYGSYPLSYHFGRDNVTSTIHRHTTNNAQPPLLGHRIVVLGLGSSI